MEFDSRAPSKRKLSAAAVRARARRVDDGMLVARARRVDPSGLQPAARVVDQAGGLVADVFNDVRLDGSPGSYEYGYGYLSDHAQAAAGKDSS